jgi:hypothetical protein
MILGLRREKNNECNIYAIEVEQRLLQHYIACTNIYPLLELLFVTDHLSITGRRLGSKATEVKKRFPPNSKEQKIHKKILRMADHLLTDKVIDVESLMAEAKVLSNNLKEGQQSMYGDMISRFIDTVLLPDFELHLIKARFRKRSGQGGVPKNSVALKKSG